MAQSPINSHQFSFNAKRIDWGIELVDQPYGGSGKLVVEWVWLWNQMNGASNVSWSAHNSLSFNQKKFDWLKRIDCRPSSFSPASLKNKKFFIFRCRPQRLQSQSLFQSIFPLGREDWWERRDWLARGG